MVVGQNLNTTAEQAAALRGGPSGWHGGACMPPQSTQPRGSSHEEVSFATTLAVLMFVIAACGDDNDKSSKSAGGGKAASNLPTSIGAGEGKLDLIAWEGYTQPQWVKPFEKATGCKVTAKYAGSSDEMVTLMRSGGGGQYDMVSASGDASLRLIYGGDATIERDKIPDYKNFIKTSVAARTTRSTGSTTASRSSGGPTR